MSGQSARAKFSPYVANMLAFLFGRGEAGGDYDPSELDMRLGFWAELTADKRPSNRLKEHGYPFGFAKSQWLLRDRLALRFKARVARMTFRERVETVREHEAMTRALELERLLGSFHYSGGDPFPSDTVDLVADNLLAWLDHQGFSVVPKAGSGDDPLTEVVSNRGLPTTFDNATGTVLLRRQPPGDEPRADRVGDGNERKRDLITLASADLAIEAPLNISERPADGSRRSAMGDQETSAAAIQDNDHGTEAGSDAAENDDGPMVECPYCGGEGILGGAAMQSHCPACNGSGQMDAEEAADFDPDEFAEAYAQSEGSEEPKEFASVYDFLDAVVMGYAEAGEFDPDRYDVRGEASPGVEWSGLDFSGVDLSNLDLREADLSRCQMGNLSGTNLSKANLKEASLEFLEDVDLTEANLNEAILYNARLRGAKLAGASLAGADLTGSNIEDAESLGGANLKGVTGLTKTQRTACAAMGALLDDADRTI